MYTLYPECKYRYCKDSMDGGRPRLFPPGKTNNRALYRLLRAIFYVYVHKGMTPTHWKFDVARRIHRCFRTRRTAPGFDRVVVTTVSWSTSRVVLPLWPESMADGRAELEGGSSVNSFFFSFALPTYLHWTLLFESTFSFLQSIFFSKLASAYVVSLFHLPAVA